MFMMIQKSDIPLLIVEAALKQVVRSQFLIFIASKVCFDDQVSRETKGFELCMSKRVNQISIALEGSKHSVRPLRFGGLFSSVDGGGER